MIVLLRDSRMIFLMQIRCENEMCSAVLSVVKSRIVCEKHFIFKKVA